MSSKSQPKLVPAPKLRFKQFEGQGEWKLVKLGDISTPVTEKVGQRQLTPVSISAGVGFVPQAEKFGRDISGNQYKNYIVVRDGEFVFNKGNSKTFPEGAIYLLEGWGEVAAPNVFISFRLKKGYINNFFKYVFEKNTHGKELRPHITSGARSNGLLNISKETFFNIGLPTTSEEEQTHIAAALSSLDAVITAHTDKLEALRQHKRGLMQQLFPAEGERVPARRFPEFEGAGEWEEKEIKPYLVEVNNKVKAETDLPVYSSTREGLKPQKEYFNNRELKNDTFYRVVGIGKIVYRHMSDDTVFKFNRNKLGFEVAISKEYPVFSTNGMNADFLVYLLNNSQSFAKFAAEQRKGGTRTRLYFKTLGQWVTLLPSTQEQQRIADCLSSLDNLISVQADKVAALHRFKRGLMQGLFPREGAQ